MLTLLFCEGGDSPVFIFFKEESSLELAALAFKSFEDEFVAVTVTVNLVEFSAVPGPALPTAQLPNNRADEESKVDPCTFAIVLWRKLSADH